MHEYVIGGCSNFLRFLLKKAKEAKSEKIELNFRNYSKQTLKVITLKALCETVRPLVLKSFQLFFDMIYGVNKVELGINDILQLIELTLGEGKFL